MSKKGIPQNKVERTDQGGQCNHGKHQALPVRQCANKHHYKFSLKGLQALNVPKPFAHEIFKLNELFDC